MSDSEDSNSFALPSYIVVREERNTGAAGNASATPKHSSYAPRNLHSNEPKQKCCFPWW